MEPDLIASLTWREIEVLRLLDARLSIEEIAEVLHIPPGIVKRHTNNLYRKLVVGTQREAIAPEGESSGEPPP